MPCWWPLEYVENYGSGRPFPIQINGAVFLETRNSNTRETHLTWSNGAETSWGCSVRPHGTNVTGFSIQARPLVSIRTWGPKTAHGSEGPSFDARAPKFGMCVARDEIAKAAKPHLDRVKIALLVAVRRCAKFGYAANTLQLNLWRNQTFFTRI